MLMRMNLRSSFQVAALTTVCLRSCSCYLACCNRRTALSRLTPRKPFFLSASSLASPASEAVQEESQPPREDVIEAQSQLESRTIAEATLVKVIEEENIFAARVCDDEEEGNGISSASATSSDSLVGHLVEIPAIEKERCQPIYAVVVAHRSPIIFCFTPKLDRNSMPQDGKRLKIMKRMASLAPDGDNALRSVLQPGFVTAASETQADDDLPPIFSPIPRVSDISLINSPMLTGLTMVDALAPIGKGQNMLLIGTSRAEMRSITKTFAQAQLEQGTQVIIGITTRDEGTDQFESDLLDLDGGCGKLKLLSVGRDSQVDNIYGESAAVAGMACAIAERIALKGNDSLVIIDTINPMKDLWDQTTRLLVDIFGVDAVVADDRKGAASSEMRVFYSGLIQRAANYNAKKGGGSLTLCLLQHIPSPNSAEGVEFNIDSFEGAGEKIIKRLSLLKGKGIPLTAQNLKKIGIPIPADDQQRLAIQHVEDLISMSDGQIWFDDELRSQGQRPPIDPQKSITRIGIGADTESRADAPAIRRLVGGLRLDLAQAASMDGAELTTIASVKQTRTRLNWLLAMTQDEGEIRSLAESCIALLAASIGAFDSQLETDGMSTTRSTSTVQNLIKKVSQLAGAELLQRINATNDLKDEDHQTLVSIIKSSVDGLT